MKKNYTSPVVEVNVFDIEDVVMTSSATTKSVGAGESANITEFKGKATGGIVVEW